MMHFGRQDILKRLDYRVLDIFNDGEHSMMNEDLVLRLTQLRNQKNLFQAELAKIVGVHYNYICRYGRGNSKPSTKVLKSWPMFLVSPAIILSKASTQDAARADFKDRELLRIFLDIERVENEDKMIINKFNEAFIIRIQVAALAARD
jgi:DNA-binding XRE family transcriptional regulator